MSCVIGAANVKIFGKAFHALVRIADDLYIEALPSGLKFHTVNSSKSAYACFTFKPDFFITYKDDSVEKRKVLLKSCLMAFRSLPNLEKTVEKCLFDLTSSADYLLLKFFCKHVCILLFNFKFIFQAVLNFCEGFNIPISIKCQTGGKPVTFSVTSLRGVDIQFVLATLADRETQSSSGIFRTSVAQTSQFSKSSQSNSFSSSMPNSSNTAQNVPKFVLTLSDDDDDFLAQQPLQDDLDNDVVPSTPPHKKFRSMFLGLSQATYTSMAPDPDEVLVVNSDDEHL
ncbi:cell cycle checkpoint control protein RAD9A [Trichonephila inaurata madagascariensis]|uniref:Cell cycle checkpoint control protein RAD9A n=1 Tax=Trichonephila inaurata madagascariensis TaxID=2747483 RepID=A0A8X6JWI8_9ARAC|nr:cell cycle checkpoint control protein RAD9A [Trichonephila inaurata madagascariensis]